MQHLVLFLYMIEFTNWNLESYNTICRCSRKIMQKSTDTKWNIYLNYTNRKYTTEKLREANRVNFIVPAEYGPNSDIEIIVQAIMRKIQAQQELLSYEQQ